MSHSSIKSNVRMKENTNIEHTIAWMKENANWHQQSHSSLVTLNCVSQIRMMKENAAIEWHDDCVAEWKKMQTCRAPSSKSFNKFKFKFKFITMCVDIPIPIKHLFIYRSTNKNLRMLTDCCLPSHGIFTRNPCRVVYLEVFQNNYNL